MLENYAALGAEDAESVELLNGMRTRALMRAADCPSGILKGVPCATLHEAIDPDADYADVTQAPWYDPAIPASARFYGVEVISVNGLGTQNRSVSEIEGVADGRIFSRLRKNGLDATYNVALFAADEEALEYGRAWLSARLDGACGVGCDPQTLTLLADCPPRRDEVLMNAYGETLATNYFPYSRLEGSGTWAEVRRNRVLNPEFGGDAGQWSQGWEKSNPGGGAVLGRASYFPNPSPSGGAYYARASSLAVAGDGIATALDGVEGPVTVPSNRYVVASVYARSTDAPSAFEMFLESYTATGVLVDTVTAPLDLSGSFTRVSIAMQNPAVAARRYRFGVRLRMSAPAGYATLDIDAAMLETGRRRPGPTAYFDGEKAARSVDPDMRQSWTGTRRFSASIMEIETVAGFLATRGIAGVSTLGGKPAMRLIATESGGSFVSPELPTGARPSGVLLATRYQAGAFDSVQTPVAMMVEHAPADVLWSNRAGYQTLRLAYSLTATYRWRIFHGGFPGDPDVWYTDIGVFDPGYSGDWFNGDSTDASEGSDYRWASDGVTSQQLVLTRVEDPAAYAARLDALRRQALRVVCTSGPIEGEKQTIQGGIMQQFEFTLASELPAVYSAPSAITPDVAEGPSPVLEAVRNLIPNGRPGASTATAVEVGRNRSTNPSFESGTTGWSHGAGSYQTLSRVSRPSYVPGSGTYALRVFQSGKSSYKQSFIYLANSTSGRVTVTPGERLRIRFSATTWALNASGGYRNIELEALALWFTSAGSSTFLDYTTLGLPSGANRLSVTFDQVVTVPPGATRLGFRVWSGTVSGTDPGGNFYLYVDAVAVNSGTPMLDQARAALPTGNYASEKGLTFSWSGATNTSQTIAKAFAPLGWVVEGSGITLVRDGEKVSIYADGDVAGGVYAPSVAVTPGARYYPTISVSCRLLFATAVNPGIQFTPRLQWLDSSGAVLSTVSYSPRSATPGGPYELKLVETVTAPAGAASARFGIASTTTFSQLIVFDVKNVGLMEEQSSAWFDGNLASGPREYSWEGAPFESASLSAPSSEVIVVDPLADPGCDPLPSPPQPPAIIEDCASEVISWSRHFYLVNPGTVPGALRMLPTVRISAEESLDAMRVWIVQLDETDDEESDVDLSSVALEDAEVYWEVTYLPQAATLVLDSLTGEVSAEVGDEVLPADRLVLGRAGAPVTFPTFSCGSAYLIAVDVAYRPANPIAPPSISLTARTEYA